MAAVEGGGFWVLPVQPRQLHHKAGGLIEVWRPRLGVVVEGSGLRRWAPGAGEIRGSIIKTAG